LGPEFPLISRIQLWYQKEIWLKIDRKHNSEHIKTFVIQAIQIVKQFPLNSNCIINIDVDPG
jgi:primosomal protein N' (replication factor Y) (superfamily II helicase)